MLPVGLAESTSAKLALKMVTGEESEAWGLMSIWKVRISWYNEIDDFFFSHFKLMVFCKVILDR